MAGIPEIGGVSAPISQVQYQARVYARQEQAVKDVGTAALNLIRALVSIDPAVGQNLNVIA